MFIISGFDKIISFGKSEMSRFSLKTGLPSDISQIIVLGAGIYEILASGLVLYGTFNKDAFLASIGSYMLILFTILATIIFYTMPLKYKPFLSNIKVSGYPNFQILNEYGQNIYKINNVLIQGVSLFNIIDNLEIKINDKVTLQSSLSEYNEFTLVKIGKSKDNKDILLVLQKSDNKFKSIVLSGLAIV